MKPGRTVVVNDATLRRMQQRIQQEHKKPEEEEEEQQPHEEEEEEDRAVTVTNNNPAVEDDPAVEEEHDSVQEEEEPDDAWYAQQLQQQEEFLQRVAQQNERRQGNNSSSKLEQEVDRLQEHLVRTSFAESAVGATAAAVDAGSSSDEEDQRWRCDDCGYDSPLMHRFCGVCGCQRPEDWICGVCQYENCMYHRFCGMCGQTRPQLECSAAVDDANMNMNMNMLEYEDMGLLEQEQERDRNSDSQSSIDSSEVDAIHQTVARLSQHHHPLPHQQSWEDPEDESSFADDCEEYGLAAPPTAVVSDEEHQPQGADSTTGWSCPTCTYHNTNPLFLACEMCDTARPAGTTPPAPRQRKQPAVVTPSSSSQTTTAAAAAADPSKAKERRLTEIMRLQQGLYKLAQEEDETTSLYSSSHPPQASLAGYSQHTTTASRSDSTSATGPETDHELALIYAQQERILAEYQKQQQQLQRR